MLKMVGIFPHPPIVIPEIGRNEWHKVKKTYSAMEELAKDFAEAGIKKFIIFSPHGAGFRDILLINNQEPLKGDLSNFNFSKQYSFKNNLEVIKEVIKHKENISGKEIFLLSDKINFEHYGISSGLDHGALVPLYFLEKEIPDLEIITISTGLLNIEDLEKAGAMIKDVVNNSDSDWGIIISGDLSHRLSPDSHYGFAEEGMEFDQLIVEAVKRNDIDSIKEIDEKVIEAAGQCGYIPLVLGASVIKGMTYKSEVKSYEHPFGVGYLVGKIETE